MQSSSPRGRGALVTTAAIFFALVLPLAPANASGPAARIDALAGDVAIQRGDDNRPLAAVTNAAVLAGDYVTTGPQARAEIEFDGRFSVLLGENVQMRFVRVDPANRQLQLAAGTIEVRLAGEGAGRSTVDTPSISVAPRAAGSVRINVDANGATSVTVGAGRADIVTPRGTQSLEPGTTLIAAGPAANPSIHSQPATAYAQPQNPPSRPALPSYAHY